MWVEFDHFSKLLGCCFPGYWCCSGVKQDKQTIKSEEKLGTKHNPQKDQWTAEREKKKKIPLLQFVVLYCVTDHLYALNLIRRAEYIS